MSFIMGITLPLNGHVSDTPNKPSQVIKRVTIRDATSSKPNRRVNMTFKEYLLSTGLTEEQATTIETGMSGHKLFVTSQERAEERLNAAKTRTEQLESDLTAANKLVTDLQKSNKGNEELQTKVTDYENKIKTITDERNQEKAIWEAKELLHDANDIEYALFKLGEIKLDKDGKAIDLESRVKALRESTPAMFKVADSVDPKAPGYQVNPNPLNPGEAPKTFDMSKMTADEINENWEAIVSQNGK